MLILAAIDLLWRGRNVLRGAAIENALTACVAIILNALGALFVLTHPRWTMLGVTPESLLLLLVYLGGTRAIYRNGVRLADSGGGTRRRKLSARTLAVFAGSAVVILAASPALAWSAKNIAELSGLGTTFVGTWLVGLSTSLPEIVTSYTAVRIGAFDLAVGNLFGSNSFNMVIFVALDLASPSGSIFAGLSPVHAIVGALAVILMSLGLASILYRAERRFRMLEPDSALMVVAYAVSIWVVYLYTHGG
jgi:cation:H+ antiporter